MLIVIFSLSAVLGRSSSVRSDILYHPHTIYMDGMWAWWKPVQEGLVASDLPATWRQPTRSPWSAMIRELASAPST